MINSNFCTYNLQEKGEMEAGRAKLNMTKTKIEKELENEKLYGDKNKIKNRERK